MNTIHLREKLKTEFFLLLLITMASCAFAISAWTIWATSNTFIYEKQIMNEIGESLFESITTYDHMIYNHICRNNYRDIDMYLLHIQHHSHIFHLYQEIKCNWCVQKKRKFHLLAHLHGFGILICCLKRMNTWMKKRIFFLWLFIHLISTSLPFHVTGENVF